MPILFYLKNQGKIYNLHSVEDFQTLNCKYGNLHHRDGLSYRILHQVNQPTVVVPHVPLMFLLDDLIDCANDDFPSIIGDLSPISLRVGFLNRLIAHTTPQFVSPYLILGQIFVSCSRLLTPHYFVACAEIIPSSINSSNVYSMTRSFAGISIWISRSSILSPTTLPSP